MDINRRDFVRSAAATGMTVMAANRVPAQAQAAANPSDVLNIGFIGAGKQAREALILSCIHIPNVRIRAICDIWSFSQRYSSRRLMGMYKSQEGRGEEWAETVNVYEDYREMLEKEEGLDVIVVATPDFYHHEHTIAALKAGYHVYCEKEMSNSLENAAKMVAASRETGKLLQIGHQRRSNPMYQFALEALKDGICGRLTTCYGQWNRGVQPLKVWPKRYEMPAEKLKKYGYADMEQYRNWRWYRAYSAGPIADLGSHQIDIFDWFLQAEPKRVLALGGADYFEDREWYEDVCCLYEYETAKGSARAYYQVLNTNSAGAYFERFAGDGGALTLSENPKKCYFIPEPGKDLPEWMEGVEMVARDGQPAVPMVEAFKARGGKYEAAMVELEEKAVIHQFHLENFFAAVRAGNKSMLNCPGEVGYQTAVSVLNVIPAVDAGGGVEFTHDQFKA